MATPLLSSLATTDDSWIGSGTPRQKTKRVRTGCLTCRARKIKCDETPGNCTNCQKRFLECDYGGDGATGLQRLSAPPLSAVHTISCEQCRVARSRCTRAQPQCSRCSLRGLSCNYREENGAETSRLTATARRRIELARSRDGTRKRRERRNTTTSFTSHVDDSIFDTPDVSTNIPDASHVLQDNQIHGPSTDLSPSVKGDRRNQSFEDIPRSTHEDDLQQAVRLPLQDSPPPTLLSGGNGHANRPSSFSHNEQLPPNVDDYVNAFFDHVAPYQANAFLHRGILGQQMRDNQASETLLLAICAISSRFISLLDQGGPAASSTPNACARGWARTATCRLMFTHNVTLDKAMAALLLCKHAAYSGDFNQAFLLAAIANRFALKLRLFNGQKVSALSGDSDAKASPWILHEQRRRVMYACYSVDRATATGLAELTFCPAASLRLPLPSEDYNFDLDIPCTTPIPLLETDEMSPVDVSYESVGIMGHYVTLVGIRYMILRYIESLDQLSVEEAITPSNVRPPWDPASEYFLCLRKLAQWRTALPLRFHLSRTVLFSRHHIPHYHLGPLVMLHLWFDMLHCELYRLALQTHAEKPHLQALFQLAPPGWLNQTQNLCVLHARQMVQTLQAVEEVTADGNQRGPGSGTPAGFTILDPSLSMLCYASTKIQLMYPSTARSPESMVADEANNNPERIEQFRVVLLFVERLARFYAPASFLLREIKNNLKQNRIVGPWSEPTAPSAGTQTPDHPWFTRLRGLDHPSPPCFSWGFEDVDFLSDALHASDISLFNQVTGVPEWLR